MRVSNLGAQALAALDQYHDMRLEREAEIDRLRFPVNRSAKVPWAIGSVYLVIALLPFGDGLLTDRGCRRSG